MMKSPSEEYSKIIKMVSLYCINRAGVAITCKSVLQDKRQKQITTWLALDVFPLQLSVFWDFVSFTIYRSLARIMM